MVRHLRKRPFLERSSSGVCLTDACPADRSGDRPYDSGFAMSLRAQALVKSYGRRMVVRGLEFEVKPGEVVGLLGPNGAGKTTCFHMIVGLLHPDSGSILLGNEDITNLPMFRRA